MRVFLDTNVLVSAFATRGLCADVLRTVLAEHELLTSDFVLGELEAVLTGRLGVPHRHVRAVLDLLRRFHVQPTPKELPDLRLRDSDDLNVVAAALAARADVLVTGDHDLLAIDDQVDTMTITNPRGLWELLKARRRG